MWAHVWIDLCSPFPPWKPASHVLTTWSPNFMKNTKSLFSIQSIPWNPIFHSQCSSGIVFVKLPLAHQTENSICAVSSLALPTSLKFLLQLTLTCSLSPGCPDTSQTLHLSSLSPCFLSPCFTHCPLVIIYTHRNPNTIIYVNFLNHGVLQFSDNILIPRNSI